jgi:hypothetical protein
MAKKKIQQQESRELAPLEKLGLRVSAMIGSPKAQLERQARIHRLDSDTDEAWNGLMELLGETDGLHLEFAGDGDVIVRWDAIADDDRVADVEKAVPGAEELNC